MRRAITKEPIWFISDKEIRELHWKNEALAQSIIVKFKEEFSKNLENKKWAEQVRREFLIRKMELLEKRKEFVYKGEELMKKNDTPLWLREVMLEMADVKGISRKINRCNNELLMVKSKITPEAIEQCRRVPLENLLRFKKVGSVSWALCPFHNETRPSFALYKDNSWYCFGCEAHGKNAIDFVMQKEDMSFMEAVKYLRNYG